MEFSNGHKSRGRGHHWRGVFNAARREGKKELGIDVHLPGRRQKKQTRPDVIRPGLLKKRF
jgi:hypothetical protein